MAYAHRSVLAREVVHYLAPKDGGLYVDATLGGGGHSEAILTASAPTGQLIGIDRDPAAIAAASERLARFGERVRFIHARYGEIAQILARLNVDGIDGLLVDAGVSSHQIDTASRGFSFSQDGPLDMRMSQAGLSCAEWLDAADEDQLTRVLATYGEVRGARSLARAVLSARAAGELETTAQLAALVERRTPAKLRKRIHPATQVFQALRIEINGELEDLESIVEAVPKVLNPGGVAAFISFHRLEDRIVKAGLSRFSRIEPVPPGVPVLDADRKRGPLELLSSSAILPSD
ncbi:MAG: 16S rRNA (cytosine(1402)-N(4))-methyltransferase RsmH, partial [Myxococcales bacterium]|nr:16S rRNA (cytosine(1402)-N(4))-methyltransferase RsmH [Myxococcales bacterium]